MTVSILEIFELKTRINEINRTNLSDITFTDEFGKPIIMNKTLIEDWRFIGMNNVDFIMTGFYKEKK